MENKEIKILAIDDNRDNLFTLKVLLAEVFPRSVIYTEIEGPGGISSAKENEPDVILLDIVMPEMDGYEVCRIIKSDKQLSEIPVIFLTALNKDKQSRILALEAGGEAFLTKPIDPIELKAQINAMLKIKESAAHNRIEKIQLEELIQKRTEELKKSNIAALNLLEDLKTENEIRKQHEQNLKTSEEKFRSIFQNHSAVKFIIDPENGNILEANNAAAVFYGWPVKTLIKMNINQISLLPFDDLKSAFIKPKNHKKIHFEQVHTKADGSRVDVEVFSSRIKIGDIEFLHFIIHDISERKKAEEKIKLLNRAVDASSISISITDSEGHIIYANPFFTKLTGYSFDEIKGKNPRFLKSGLHSKEFYTNLWNTILAGKEWSGEFRNRKKNGELYWGNAIISPIIDSDGITTNFVAIKEDITERKTIVEELCAAKDKAEESDRLKTAFLHNISHEIRTPMNAIIGFSALLSEPELDEESKTFFTETLTQSSNQLLSIINDIVDISNIEAGIINLSKEVVNINDTLMRLENQFCLKAKEKGIVLRKVTPLVGEEAKIITDSTKFMQVFSNLLSNAFKFTKEGSIEFGYSPGKEFIEFYVSDTGIGIPGDHMTRIFDRFYQVDYKMHRLNEGTGLGLSISKGYVDLMGGKIWVDSEPGKGARFIFTLPFRKPEEKEKAISTEQQNYSFERVYHILVAEDDKQNSHLINIFLASPDFNVTIVGNGAEAVDYCKSGKPVDLVLMDLRMPVMDGLEATKLIKEYLPHIPVIAQTALTNEADKNSAIVAGCNDFISKPYRKDALITKIRNNLSV